MRAIYVKVRSGRTHEEQVRAEVIRNLASDTLIRNGYHDGGYDIVDAEIEPIEEPIRVEVRQTENDSMDDFYAVSTTGARLPAEEATFTALLDESLALLARGEYKAIPL